MVESPLTALADLAVTVSTDPRSLDGQIDLHGWYADPIMVGLTRATGRASLFAGECEPITDLLRTDPQVAALEDEPEGVMVFHPGGGRRLTIDLVALALLASALGQTYLLGLPNDETTLAGLLIANLQELKRALNGEPIRYQQFAAYSGVSLADGVQLVTPWGTLRPAPPSEPSLGFGFRPTTATILESTKVVSVALKPGPNPDHEFDEATWLAEVRASQLFPLACALGSVGEEPAAPVRTWQTAIVPFLGNGGFSSSLSNPRPAGTVDLTGRTGEIEHWARLIDESHDGRIDVAGQRLVSALAMRWDRSDALIDAVTAWENLVGTKMETTFRVTAALTRMLEKDPSKRLAFRKTLARVYDVRSQIVHGETVDPNEVDEAAGVATSTAIAALRECYSRGPDWLKLKSSERADRLLLDTE